MEIEHLHRLIDEKKWTLLLHELDQLISKKENFEMDEVVIAAFEKIDKDFREKNASRYYFDMWKIAYRAGKIKLAKNYAEYILDYLIELKRVPAILKLQTELVSCGLLRASKKFQNIDHILGKKNDFSLVESGYFGFHPELYKDSKAALKNYLQLEDVWDVEHWKLVYEFILKFYYDKDIFLLLTEKTIELNKKEHQKKFIRYLHEKNVNTRRFDVKKADLELQTSNIPLHADYDQLAMDVMSGAVEPSVTEQKKILISIQTISDEELMVKGKDMIVAFGLLGMDKVVVNLSERVVPLLAEVKERISIQFMMAQSLFNSGDFYRVADLIDDVTSSEPLLPDEVMAFSYLKAESLLKLKKYKIAKELFLKIKKQNPHYRLVGERLRNLEEIK